MGFTVIIPARYGSSRLPGKVLADLGGHPLVRHTWARACESGADAVIIATDHAQVAAVCRDFGAHVRLTSSAHATGTDRLAEAVMGLGLADASTVVNVQADEPLLPPAMIRKVAENLEARPEADIATLCLPVNGAAELFDPNVVKVVRDARGYALYFSRAPIPWERDAFSRGRERLPTAGRHHRHVGLYAYRAGYLRRFATEPPCPLEEAESLEQLRALYGGCRIHVDVTTEALPPGVDTAADLERVRRLLSGLPASAG